MNKSKGFTIIELIVVIAIIAILAAIVLVNVTTYINKAKDARIKSDMGSIALAMGSCFSSNQGSSYAGCFANTTYIPTALTTDITGQGGTAVAVTSDATIAAETPAGQEYCASTKLNDGTYLCVDYTGVTKNTATSICTTTITACPN